LNLSASDIAFPPAAGPAGAENRTSARRRQPPARRLQPQPFIGGKSRENTGCLRKASGAMVQNWLTL